MKFRSIVITGESMKFMMNVKFVLAMLCIWLGWVGVAHADKVTYVYTNPQGTPLAEADAQGNIIARYDYRPYGGVVSGQGPDGPGYTGHVQDPETGLVYMQARYYDPATERFLSADPVMPSPGNLFNFSRYDYANNNPIGNIDPDGRQSAMDAGIWANEATMARHGSMQVKRLNKMNVAQAKIVAKAIGVGATGEAGIFVRGVLAVFKVAEKASRAPNEPNGNTNPYAGPVDSPVVVVDKYGNAMPVEAGQSMKSSPNGDYQQVRGADGQPTGDRLDRGGHRTQPDQQARQPHAHRSGVVDDNGNRHLPINTHLNKNIF
jgi:RHS repeat-associated protein